MVGYDDDSDEDWDEEEEGEHLSDNSDNEDNEEKMDDYEVDNEFFVPSGYLSDGEEEEDAVFNAEIAKEKGKEKRMHTEKEFEKERKSKTHQPLPRLLGVCFEGPTLDTEVAANEPVMILEAFKGILVGNNNYVETGFSKSGTCMQANFNNIILNLFFSSFHCHA